jgi:prevent-host-death family protein
MGQTPQEISAAEFKSKCLKLMDIVERERTQIIITKRGQPVAKLVPFLETPPSIFGYMAGTATINGDILQPLDVAWNAENE